MKSPERIAVIDTETDPFAYGVIPKPFSAGFYNGEIYVDFWGDNCIEELIYFLDSLEERYIIYAHNGGKFDFLFMLKYFSKKLLIINGRIVKGNIGKHEMRDSYAALPIPLSGYQKDVFDYDKMLVKNREKNKEEILHYQKNDCIYLYELISTFCHEFDYALTVGGAAMEKFKTFHEVQNLRGKWQDDELRPYYYGGRVQCFKTGIVKQPLKIYDVNSMYPDAMKRFKHPITNDFSNARRITKHTCFVTVEGKNYGAFPRRLENGRLDFTCDDGVFNVSIHEFEAALETGTFKPQKIIKTFEDFDAMTFDNFVDYFYDARNQAKRNKDKIHDIFYKLILNSAYGKFAQNPEDFKDAIINEGDLMPEPWVLAHENMGYTIWEKPANRKYFLNVATAASITGAARSTLLRGLSKAKDIVYCDTDSIICSAMDCEVSETELGAWKLEGEGVSAAIAGKKMYAIFDASGKCIKQASKGARLKPEQIINVATGDTVEYENPVPAFKLDGIHKFTKRRIKATG
jgi:hypothetical protein